MSHTEALSAYKLQDFERAFELWLEESKQNNHQAMANLGLMYLKGEGVIKDFQKAKAWFERASEFDNDSANYNLALMYQSKIGVEEDIDKAIEYFRRAVAQNHQGACFRLALLLLRDRDDVQKLKEGFDCMLAAALRGHPMAKMQMSGIDKEMNSTCKLNKEFREKSEKEQMAIVTDALDRYIRPILIKDGGNIVLIDFLHSPEIEIRLAYQGNCAGCSMASTSTYELIKNTLSGVIDENIKVYIL